MKKFKQIYRNILFRIKLIISFIINMSMTHSDTIIRLLPKDVSDSIKIRIKMLLDEDIPGIEKQKEVTNWIVNELIPAIDKPNHNIIFIDFYNSLEESNRKIIIMSLVGSMYEMLKIDGDI